MNSKSNVNRHYSIPIKGFLNYEDSKQLIAKLRRRIEYEVDGQPINYRAFMLPDTKEEELEFIRGAGFEEDDSDVVNDGEKTSSISLCKLLDETRDFIDSPDFNLVLTSCLNEVFSIFDQHAFVSTLLPNNEPMMGSSIQEVTHAEALELQEEKKVILANLLPTISRQAHLIIAGNEYLNVSFFFVFLFFIFYS